MQLLCVKCRECGKRICRTRGRLNEARKYKWKSYCSLTCQSKAKNKSNYVLCALPSCNNRVTRKKADLGKTERSFCSHSCAAEFYNLRRVRKTRICANPSCSSTFYGDNKYCSAACIPKRESKYSAQVILEEIRNFKSEHERIPTKMDLMKIYRVTREFFGTWNNAIKKAGFEPNPVMFAKKYIAKDGHRCDSLAEMIIDDWLYVRDISHKRSYPYPSNLGLTVDFLVEDFWIEFFGLSGQHKRYDEPKAIKISLASKLKLSLIEVYPKHLFPENKLDEVLKPLINFSLKAP